VKKIIMRVLQTKCLECIQTGWREGRKEDEAGGLEDHFSSIFPTEFIVGDIHSPTLVPPLDPPHSPINFFRKHK
jgi:hypothetical protein